MRANPDGAGSTFGDQLRLLRTAAGLTQEELAERAGLTAAGVSALERGHRRRPYSHTVWALANALGLSEGVRSALLTARLAHPPRRYLLPAQATPLVGRETELQELQRLLERADVRLITILGIGGVGKTRLAVAVASHAESTFGDGALFVDLSAIRDPALVIPTLAASLEVHELAGETTLDRVESALRDSQMLLVIDNCEHLLGMATELSAVLSTCPNVKLLATSREPLRLRWEHTYLLQPLPVPEPDLKQPAQVLAQVASVALFLERARASDSRLMLEHEDIRTIAALCRRLDGLPLAIELAAARVRTVPLQALLGHLGARLDILKGARDAPERHQSLQAAMAWSYDLLSPDERTVLRRFSAFAGSCTTEAISHVHGAAALDELSSLVDKSLLLLDGASRHGARYRMLDTVRTYAHELFVESDEHRPIQLRQISYFLDLAERAAKARGSDQLVWLERLDLENENLRTALSSALEFQSPVVALRLATALNWFWRIRGNLYEATNWLERALAAAPVTATTERSAALEALGLVKFDLGDFESALAHLELSRELLRASGHAHGSPATLVSLAKIAATRSDDERARLLARESLDLSRELGDTASAASSLNVLGNVARHRGDYHLAAPLYLESEAIVRANGDGRGLAGVLQNRAQLALYQGDYGRARILAEESRVLAEQFGDRIGVANALGCLGEIASDLAAYDVARKLFTEEMAILREVGPKRYIGATLISCAAISEDHVKALDLLQDALVALGDVGDRRTMALGLLRLAVEIQLHGPATESTRMLGAADALQRATGAAYRLKVRDEDRALRTRLREALGDEQFCELLAEGEHLTTHQAVDYALTLN